MIFKIWNVENITTAIAVQLPLCDFLLPLLSLLAEESRLCEIIAFFFQNSFFISEISTGILIFYLFWSYY